MHHRQVFAKKLKFLATATSRNDKGRITHPLAPAAPPREAGTGKEGMRRIHNLFVNAVSEDAAPGACLKVCREQAPHPRGLSSPGNMENRSATAG
jgi:hypothetical protein